MRLWSISPSYLDQKGLVTLWREALLGQSVLLKGEYTQCSKCLGLGKYDEFENKKEWQRYIDCSVCKRTGKIKTPYYNHPQLLRFKETNAPLFFISLYLEQIYNEAKDRKYNFDYSKIIIDGRITKTSTQLLTVTKGQIDYEFEHLQNKLEIRDNNKFWDNKNETESDHMISNNDIIMGNFKFNIKQHPLFHVIDGKVESWEKIK